MSSSLWGDEATARMCTMIMASNNSIAQQIQENRHDLLDLMSEKEIMAEDDLGLSAPFLAIYYDRPEMLRYLHKRGIVLSQPCDPMKFGTPMFYAVTMNRQNIISELDSLGYSVNDPCDSLSQLPIDHAKRIDDFFLLQKVEYLCSRSFRAWTLFRKHFLRIKYRKRYLYLKSTGIPLLQRCIRGMFGRKISRPRRLEREKKRKLEERAEKIRLGILVDDDDEEEEGGGEEEGEEGGGEVEGEETKGDGVED